MSNVVYLTEVQPANATPPPATRELERKPAPRFMEQMRTAFRRALAYADLLGRQQREIAALQARVERLENICEKAIRNGDDA